MFKKISILGLMLAPVVSFAASAPITGKLGNIGNIINQIGEIIKYLIPIAFALIVLSFFWGLAKFVFNVADEEGRKAGKDIMIYSVIAIFVASSVWGIVWFLNNALGISDVTQTNTDFTLPQVTGGNTQ